MTASATALHPSPADLRHSTDELVRAAAAHALAVPADEDAERLRILGMLLDPSIAVVDRAIASFERNDPFSTTERERIAAYVTKVIDRKVLGADGYDDVVSLHDLASGKPTAWLFSFARSCVSHGYTEVRRDRERTVAAGVDGQVWIPAVHSAEDAFLQQQQVNIVHTVAEVVDTWGDRSMSPYEKTVEVAHALRLLRGVPEVHVGDSHARRWVAETLDLEDGAEKVMESLQAFRDLASGIPTWDRIGVDDRLLDLWIDFTAEQADSLLMGGSTIVMAIVRGAIAYAPQPQEAYRVAVRRIAKGMSSAPGWSSLVMELERSWVCEHFGPRTLRDNMDRRSAEQAEDDRKRMAAGWSDAALRAIEFPGRPLGPGVVSLEAVASWFDNALRIAIRRG